MKQDKHPVKLSDKKSEQSTSSSEKLSDISKRLAQSDRNAFKELFELLHKNLIRFCWRYTQDEETSRDIVQDVFVTLWEKRSTLDPEKSLVALMYTMVRNKSINLFRDTRYSDRLDSDETLVQTDPEPDEQVNLDMLEAHVKQWIDALPPRRRQAFKLSRFEGLSHTEIAEVMNLAPRTVSTHVMLALRDLRLKLQALQKESQEHA
ncbi:MAG: RNA polymerase sigma-70 factor [Bacteroidetes bacterium]|nr:RNA polymerase sigma-70 factor [Bacteroidota bacterium]MCY4233106.1 RNA polymerase sigma-70 factor [Bacteroidota bacterium]